MVLQVPNTPDHEEVGRAIDTICAQWPDLTYDVFAHVFGEHTPLVSGPLPYISPERVQETTAVRVLIAKDAISTVIAPAEVMISFRTAKGSNPHRLNFLAAW